MLTIVPNLHCAVGVVFPFSACDQGTQLLAYGDECAKLAHRSCGRYTQKQHLGRVTPSGKTLSSRLQMREVTGSTPGRVEPWRNQSKVRVRLERSGMHQARSRAWSQAMEIPRTWSAASSHIHATSLASDFQPGSDLGDMLSRQLRQELILNDCRPDTACAWHTTLIVPLGYLQEG
jgi:hypothetical protein